MKQLNLGWGIRSFLRWINGPYCEKHPEEPISKLLGCDVCWTEDMKEISRAKQRYERAQQLRNMRLQARMNARALRNTRNV